MTKIDLERCEISLRKFYNLTNKGILYIKELNKI